MARRRRRGYREARRLRRKRLVTGGLSVLAALVLLSGWFGLKRWEARPGEESEKQTETAPENSREVLESPENEVVSAESVLTVEQIWEKDPRIPVEAKGIYITGPIAGTVNTLNELIDLVDRTELNAMVIDIKNDSGEITYRMDLDMVEEIGAAVPYIQDIDALVKRLKEKDIYLIARIVAFKDPILAESCPEYSLKNTDGTTFRDKDGLSWVNPFDQEVWKYLVDISREAVRLGFDEIQYDYIRFSTDKGMENVDFGPQAAGMTKQDAINGFVEYAYRELAPMGVFVSADVYGTIINSETDGEIVGQHYQTMAKYLDYICPMVYPSHYANDVYEIPVPDKDPYGLIYASMMDSQELLKLQAQQGHVARVRPWLQDFTASWLPDYLEYGPEEIRAQINGVYDAGYGEWLLWNGSNIYTAEGLVFGTE